MSKSLAERVSSRDRRALAQAITLVESTREDHGAEAGALLDEVLPRTGGSIRVAVTGSPGAGKSTFIEALGLRLLAQGHRVAVLAIDPSSQRSGGSILGDKTRMEDLTRHPDAFVRPSPSGGTLGGVARRTRDALLLCEAAGYDVVLVETVGVGQSETAAADLVDCMLLLATPGAGDELQGIKRGIMELADVVAVTKSDGDLLPSAQRAASDLRHAVHLLRPKYSGWAVPVLPVSAVEGSGIDEVWQAVVQLRDHLAAGDGLAELRARQAVTWLWNEVRADVLRAFRDDAAIAEQAQAEESAVRDGTTSSSAAAQRLIALHRRARDLVTRPRAQLWVVVVLTLFAVVRGSFWAVASVAPSPIDEMQHFDYVRSVARGDGVPTVGSDHIGEEVLRFAKESPTFAFRSFPYPGDLSGPTWVGADPQYEGIQGPTYYAALAPFYWLGRPWGTAGSFYAARLGSVLLGALAIPLAWLLTRRLLPRRPEAWLLPPVLLVALNALTAGAATLGNDIIVLTGTAASAVLLLRAIERKTIASAVGAGLAAGLVLLGKTTAMAMVPVLGLLALPHLLHWWREDERRDTYRWVGAYGIAFTAPFALWTLWNLFTYHAISAAARAESITGPLQESYPRSLETVRDHWQSIRGGIWVGQLADLLPRYHHLWEIAAVSLIAVGALVAWRRRATSELGVLGWGAAAHPLTFVTIVGVFMVVLGDTGLLLGRYVWVAVVPVVIALGVACSVIGGRRAGLAVALVLVAVASWQERDLSHRFLRTYYEFNLPGEGLAPVVEQSWSDGYTPADAIEVDVTCPVRVIDLGLVEPPATIVVRGATGSATATRTEDVPSSFARYWLDDGPLDGPLEIPVTSEVAASRREREPAGSLVGGSGDPMLRVHCPVDDPGGVRFDQLYDPAHPPVSRSMLFAWPTAWAVTATGAAALAVIAAILSLVRPRRSVDDADTVG